MMSADDRVSDNNIDSANQQFVEVWEVMKLQSNKTWESYVKHPWVDNNNNDIPSPDDINLPGSLPSNPIKWMWASNWKQYSNKEAQHDGWEYASKFSKFASPNRKPKTTMKWNSKYRRRLWRRMMRCEKPTNNHGNSNISNGFVTTDFASALPKIQHSLSSIHMARMRIEDIVKEEPEVVHTEQLKNAIQRVQGNINDIMTALDQYETQQTMIEEGQMQNQGPATNAMQQLAVIKKLRSDLNKEEVCLYYSLLALVLLMLIFERLEFNVY